MRLTALFTALLLGLAALPAHAGETAFQPGVALVAMTQAGQLDDPHDMTLSADGNLLLVADAGHDAIAVLDPATLKVLGSFGKGDLSEPHDVAFLDTKTVLVADTGNDRIAVYAFDGTALKAELTASWREHIHGPEGIAVTADGGYVYVANEDSDTLLRLDPKGEVVNGVGGFHPRDMVSLTHPHDVALAPDGRVFVSDSGDDRMITLNSELVYLGRYKGDPWDFDLPTGVVFDDGGDLWITDVGNNRVLRLNAFMTIQQTIGTGDRGDGPGELNHPDGIESKGKLLWVADTGNDRVMLLRRTD